MKEPLLLLLLCALVQGDDSCPEACSSVLIEKVYPSNESCHLIPVSCLKIEPGIFDDCNYGEELIATYTYLKQCEYNIPEECLTLTSRPTTCRYCFQVSEAEYTCDNTKTDCNPHSTGRRDIKVQCEVNKEVICDNVRLFHRKVTCSFTTGKKWSTAIVLSVTLGGFGADRFYLGHWRQGLGKLFTFGGLGVWTLVDIILISVGYIGPADNSLYI